MAKALSIGRVLLSSEWVLHACDNRKCCNPSHLYIGNRSDNMRDAVSRGRWVSPAIGNKWTRGELNGCAKLTVEKVKEIKRKVRAGNSQRGVAREYGIAQSTVSSIMTGKRWSGVD